jgi:hypothetical protein
MRNYYLAMVCYLVALNVDASGTLHPDFESTLLNAAMAFALATPLTWVSRFVDALFVRE